MDLEISHLLSSEHSISEEEKSKLKDLKNEFPWSEIIQITYLKSLKDTHDLRFKDELKRVALITQDRKNLYRILYGVQLQKAIDKIEVEMAALPEVEGLIPPDWEKSVSVVEDEEIITALTPEIRVPNDVPPVLEEQKKVESEEYKDIAQTEPLAESEKLEKISEEVFPTDNNQKDTLQEDQLNELIISEAVDATIRHEVIENIEENRETNQPIENHETVDLPITKSGSNHIQSDDFISWLTESAQAINYPSFSDSNKKSSPEKVTALIDKFIQNEPQITRGKSKEYGLQNLASESLVDNEEFVTETLAEIYASQGNNSKAKRAFQLLSLKYPEKSIYFAARIKQLGRKK